jgi:hypothetical protein
MFTIDNTTSTGEQTFQLTDLSNGQHQLQIYRNYSNTPTTTTFTLREGYDMAITISSNGSVSQTETRARSGNWGNNGNNDWRSNRPMSTSAFNTLYNATKAKTSSTARTNYLSTQFEVQNRMLTSTQAKQLISLVNSESLRLRLAKEVYPKITDHNNFSVVVNLLKSSANRSELNSYVANLDLNETETTNAAYTAMTTTKFNQVYREVAAETSVADRTYYLTNFFNKDFNYYTSAQVRQLLMLVNSETERFNLAKEAYRGITDRDNYYNEIYPVLSSSYNRSDLRTYITNYDQNNQNSNTNTRVAMTSTAFNTLYQNIYYQSSGNRYNAINTALTTSGNYFTSAQARQMIQLITDENSKLALAKIAYPTLVDRTNYTVFNDLFTYQSTRNDFATFVNNYNNGVITNTPTTGMAMADADFNTLYRNINNAWTASNKFTQASSAFQSTTNRFTTTQVRQILMLITTESDKLSLAKMAYDNLVDQYNYAQLGDVFSSTENRTEWNRYIMDIQNGGTGVTYRTAMSESEYNSLSRSVQLTFGFGAKQSALTDIFNKETNYFTTAQIKELIRMVSNESNRLELAKLAYNNAVDPANYTNLYDLFSSQTTKDELNAYISANANIR